MEVFWYNVVYVASLFFYMYFVLMDIYINIFDFSINLTPWHPSMKHKYLSVQGYLLFKSKRNNKESVNLRKK